MIVKLTAFFLLYCAVPSALMAQQRTVVQFQNLRLVRESQGWRVLLLDRSPSIFSLRSDDLIKEVDDRDASELGPLAIAAFLDDGAVRSFPMLIKRGSQTASIVFYTGAGSIPAAQKLTKSLRVSSGSTAPNFSLSDLSGHQTNLQDYRGSWILLNFWATWCGPCQLEAPVLNRLAKEYSDRLHVVAIAVQDEHKKLDEFSLRTKPSYMILESGDLNSPVALAYGVNNGMGSATMPYSVLVRPDGSIAYVQAGYEETSPLEAEVAAQIRSAITK